MGLSHLIHLGDLAAWKIGDDPDEWWASLRERIELLRDDGEPDRWDTSLVASSHYSQAVLIAVRGGWARVLGRSAGGGLVGTTHGPDLLTDASVLAFLDEVAQLHGGRVVMSIDHLPGQPRPAGPQ